MNRRTFIKTGVALLGTVCATPYVSAITMKPQWYKMAAKDDDFLKDYIYKMQNFDKHHKEDVFLDSENLAILKKVLNRLTRLQRIVGHGNFYLLNFDDALNISKSYSSIGRFTKKELNFMEMLFYEDCRIYGFFGEKPIKNLTEKLRKREIVKIPYTGNYLYKERSVRLYNKMKKELGDQVILTSGVRNIIKQFKLFLNKTYKSNGNLSLASRSLAPPGYSFHGVGDFDVGQVGLGLYNFTEKFTNTTVFKKLMKSGYIKLRYECSNLFGVRFEPWHIKI